MYFSSDREDNVTELTIENELNSLRDTYGPNVVVEIKDVQHRMCVLRCVHPFDCSGSFRIYLFLSRHYPIISQLFVRFKLFSVHNNINSNELLNLFQIRIQTIFDETSSKCFYYGKLCLHRCLLQLKRFFYSCHEKEKLFSSITTNKTTQNPDDDLLYNLDLDSSNSIINDNKQSSNRIFLQSSSLSSTSSSSLSSSLSSSTQISDGEVSNGPSIRANARTCGARFVGGTFLICFGRTLNLQQRPKPAPPILYNINYRLINQPQSLHTRSTSLTVTKSRGNSSTDEHSSR